MNRYFGTHTLGGEWHALLPRYQLLAQRVQGRRVLDIGCGTGIGSSLLLEMGAESVHGVDHRPEVVELARLKHDKPGLSFHVMLWENLEFDDDSFDLVVCLDPASPVTDHNLLVEVRRVLRPQGEYICAVERSIVSGLETLLPRYGYANPSDQVDINPGGVRVPQIGALSNFFDSVFHLTQRPQLGYIFEPELETSLAEEPSTNPRIRPEELKAQADEKSPVQASRRLPDSNQGGLWHAAPAPGEEQGSGHWIPVDQQLELDDMPQSGIQLFFCGGPHLPTPPLAEVRLPYYQLVERFAQVIADLQARQSLGGEASSFDEVLDAPVGFDTADQDNHETGEFGRPSSWDRTPTGLHRQPLPGGLGGAPEQSAPLVDLDTYYAQMRAGVDELEHLTRQAIAERDQYIDHLVGVIEQLEQRLQARPSADAGFSGEEFWEHNETTGVFKIDDLARELAGQPARDDLAADTQQAAADPAPPKDIADAEKTEAPQSSPDAENESEDAPKEEPAGEHEGEQGAAADSAEPSEDPSQADSEEESSTDGNIAHGAVEASSADQDAASAQPADKERADKSSDTSEKTAEESEEDREDEAAQDE